MNREHWERLESRVAWLDESMDALNRTVAELERSLRLQQDELRFLYRKLRERSNDGFDAPADDKPPHY